MLPNSRTQVKQEAKEYLRASYWPAVATALVLALVTGGITAGSGGAEINYTINGSSSFYRLQRLMPAAVSLSGVVLALKIFVLMPLEAGCRSWFLHRLDNSEGSDLQDVFTSEKYERTVRTMLRLFLTILLWTFVLIIPGIVAAYRYLFVPYILEDYPDLTPAEAMDLSAEMTRGHKWDLFVFHLSFILWGILTLITGMLAGIFYAWPYKALAEAVVYDDIRNEWEDRHA